MQILRVKSEAKGDSTSNYKNHLTLFDQEVVAFSFKDSKVGKGQYRLPFAFTLPTKLPGSFKYINTRNGDNIQIRYQIELYFENFKNITKAKKEIEVREFLFTGPEIDEDMENHLKF